MENFETMKRMVSNVVTFNYTIKYTNENNIDVYFTSKEKYKNPGIARKAGLKKMESMIKELKECKNFTYKLKQVVMPKKELNKLLAMNVIKEDEEYESKWNILRKAKKYSIEEVLSQYVENDQPVDFDGELIPMGSHRYANFKFNGTTCKGCNITGQYFRMERFPHNTSYHFNLYAVNEFGEEQLMTKDHLFPKSKGGDNEVHNYQCLCERCNKSKGTMSQENFLKMMETKKKY